MDGHMDGETRGRTDEQTLIKRCKEASKNMFLVRDEDEVIPTATAPDTPQEAEASAAGEADISEGFQLVLGNSTDNPKAVLSIGGNAEAWARPINWTQDALPLDLQIRHEKKDKYQTPLVRRLRNLQKQMTKKLKGGRQKSPHFLSQVFFVTVLDGELQNQSVSYYKFFFKEPGFQVETGRY